jgi:hypothetical protein
MLTAVVAGAGRCFGWQPAAKVSTMIMRRRKRGMAPDAPPQCRWHRHRLLC